MSIDNGERNSTAGANRSATKQNLVITDAQVQKILFNGNKLLVLATRKRKTLKLSIIKNLSAGAVGSPQLLMLSGVGPYTSKEHNIPVVADLGVGQNQRPS